ncbi:MAG: tRNA lysidine(34) synthetase TilS [SAR202 cluster bacterium]|nr:tRNA lysidine(34) synthetase TilS [SAR202 cluster bacterium]
MTRNRAVVNLESAVRREVAAAGLSGSRIVVAVSGGQDSLALLHALSRQSQKLRIELVCAHLDHGLRGEASAADHTFVAAVAAGLGIPFAGGHANVAAVRKAGGMSVEEAARAARYAFLTRTARENGAAAVALGHTLDDQAETVLLHILRGSGIAGLRGMALLSEREIEGAAINLLRPMLGLRRADTAAYCQALELAPRLDESNLDTRFTRNRVRLELIPLLETFNPAIRESLARLARSAADIDDFATANARDLLSGVVSPVPGGVSLNRQGLGGLPDALRVVAVREALRQVRKGLEGIEEAHLDAVLDVAAGRAGRSTDLPGGLEAVAGYDEVVISRRGEAQELLPPIEEDVVIAVPGNGQAGGWSVKTSTIHPGQEAAPDTRSGAAISPPDDFSARFDAESLGAHITVRRRRDGDRFQPLGMAEAKKLQDFFVDEKVARRVRDRVPIVEAEGRIAWVVGRRIAEWARATEGRPQIEISFEITGEGR